MTTYEPAALLARADKIDRLIETWKGRPEYAETMRMEAWALRTAATSVEGVGEATPENTAEGTTSPS